MKRLEGDIVPIKLGANDIEDKAMEQLTLRELELRIVEKWKESGSFDRELLTQRCLLLKNDFEWDDSCVEKLAALNDLLTNTAMRLTAEAQTIFEQAAQTIHLPYTELSLTMCMYPSWINDEYEEADVNITNVLADYMATYPHDCYEHSIWFHADAPVTLDLSKNHCAFDDQGQWDQTWLAPTWTLWVVAIPKDFPLCYPLHCLLDHSPYSIQDILAIKDLDTEITIKIENEK